MRVLFLRCRRRIFPPGALAVISILLLCLFFQTALSTKFQVNLLNQSLQNESSKCYHLSGFENTVFGFASSGQLNAELDLDVRDGIKGHLTFAACSMSQVFVRDTSCERRHPQLPDKDLCEDISRLVCTDKSEPPLRVSRCHTKPLESGSRNQLFLSADPELSERITLKPTNESIPADSHAMYFAIVVFCPSDSSEQSDAAFDLTGNMNYSNPSSVRRGLGFEETLFPLLSQVVLYMLATLCVSLMLSLIITPLLRLPFRQLPFAVLFACLTKGIMALFTFLYFSSVATDGSRARWYTYTKICLAGVADVSFIVVVIAMSSGYNLFPTVWFIDGRSPLMFVYIGVTLQILIIIIVKIMFPFKYLTVVTYCVTAGAMAALVIVSSHRNYRFLGRYADLIERAHIYVKTTPIPRMRRFFAVNLAIVPTVYIFKIVSVGVWDYGLRRPDLMWGCLEITDAVLLMWYTFAVLPRKKSGIYVDLSNVSNARLQQVAAWRARQEAEDDSNTGEGSQGQHQVARPNLNGEGVEDEEAAEEGRVGTQQRRASDPPTWISWRSGMSLPRPNTYTWGSLVEVARILRREPRFVPVLPSSIVIGTSSDSPDTLHLNIGVPITGPESIPKTFDEKGNEIVVDPIERSVQTGTVSSTQASDAADTTRNVRQRGELPDPSSSRRLGRIFGRRERCAGRSQRSVRMSSNISVSPAAGGAENGENERREEQGSTASCATSGDGVVTSG